MKDIGKGLDPVIIGDYHDHEEEEVVVSEVIFLHLHLHRGGCLDTSPPKIDLSSGHTYDFCRSSKKWAFFSHSPVFSP